MARRVRCKLDGICSALNTSEKELAHHLGLSLAALKAINRSDPPLYLQLALTALLSALGPDPRLVSGQVSSIKHTEIPPVRLAG